MRNGIIKKIHNGYIFIKAGMIWLPEHKLIMEEKLKRFLTKDEVIHHINYDRTDNRIENLMLFPNQREHAKFHRKLEQFGFTIPIIRQIKERWISIK